MGQQESGKRHIRLARVAVIALAALFAAGCAAKEPANEPYVPQITHSPQETDAGDIDSDGESDEPGGGGDSDDGESDELAPPEIPDEIYENTLEGAEAAARFYYRALEYGFSSYDTGPLEFICHDKSETCAINIESVKALERKGRTFVGGKIHDGDLLENIDTKDELLIAIAVRQEGATVFENDGSLLVNKKEYLGKNEFIVLYDDGRWKLTAITSDDEGV